MWITSCTSLKTNHLINKPRGKENTNSLCLLDTVLVLISDNFLLNFPPSIPCNPLVAPFKNSLVTPSLLCVHIHSLSPDWERWLWPSKYLLSFHMPFLWWYLQFLVRVFPYFVLKWRKENNTYLTHVCTHRWSRHESGRCCSLSFILIYFLSFYLFVFSFYININLVSMC